MLIKAVVTAISKYIMQCHKLPAKVCEEVNKLVRNFLWGSMVDKKKMHLVGWHKVTNPTNMGRLGIFDMQARNTALLGKLCWWIASSLEMLWAQMLTCKYLTLLRLKGHSRNQTASRIWKACKVGGVIFNKGLRWSIANGESVSA